MSNYGDYIWNPANIWNAYGMILIQVAIATIFLVFFLLTVYKIGKHVTKG